ncbi:hypothetical protein [Kitasatospora sp. KL5]|uniref:hypothetical protein n=1 Tax=Kitasatospora sp. KL5 TaxID=3425125 RepID=UPI003D6E6AD2
MGISRRSLLLTAAAASTAGLLPTAARAAGSHTQVYGSGNTAAVTLPAAAQTRYLRLQFTGNTGRPAGQLSALQVFAQ